MKILVINAGSSSLKYQLFDMESKAVLAKGNCECIGAGGMITHKKTGADPYHEELALPDHEAALSQVLRLLTDPVYGVMASVEEIDAVGHRIVHGGEKCKQSMRVTDALIRYLETIVPLNPLHGPPAIVGIKSCLKLMGDTPQVCVFDTSFYGNMPESSYIYPIPYELYEEKQIRRYGFHGTSHRYVSNRAAELVGKPLEDLKIITCHLGNGSSITAVKNGVAIDTSMGFTPQEGIPMGTRSGSIDPTVVTYLMTNAGMTGAEIEDLLNRKSGLLGISGVSNDFRQVTAAAAEGNRRAQLAIDILVSRIKKVIGSYVAEMNGLDVLVFTAGIGENQWNLRELVCGDGLTYLGVEIDKEKNHTREECDISAEGARVRTWVIPTDEEYMIALDTQRLCR